MPTSVRLDAETEALLRRLARERGCSKSEVIRDALHALAGEVPDAEHAGPYSAIADLIGIAAGEPKVRARDHKRAYRDALSRRHHARHPG